MLTFLITAVCFVAAIQFGFHARQYLYSPAEVEEWWPPDDMVVPGRRERLQEEQRDAYNHWRLWAHRARRLYNAGLGFASLAVALAVVPPMDATLAESSIRWATAAIAVIAALVDFMAMVARRQRRTRTDTDAD